MFNPINWCCIQVQTRLYDEEGQALTEYAIVLTLLVAGVVAAMGVLTGKISGWINNISATLP